MVRQRRMIEKLCELMIALSASGLVLHVMLFLLPLGFSMFPFGSRFNPTWFVFSFVFTLGVFGLSTQFYLQHGKDH